MITIPLFGVYMVTVRYGLIWYRKGQTRG